MCSPRTAAGNRGKRVRKGFEGLSFRTLFLPIDLKHLGGWPHLADSLVSAQGLVALNPKVFMCGLTLPAIHSPGGWSLQHLAQGLGVPGQEKRQKYCCWGLARWYSGEGMWLTLFRSLASQGGVPYPSQSRGIPEYRLRSNT